MPVLNPQTGWNTLNNIFITVLLFLVYQANVALCHNEQSRAFLRSDRNITLFTSPTNNLSPITHSISADNNKGIISPKYGPISHVSPANHNTHVNNHVTSSSSTAPDSHNRNRFRTTADTEDGVKTTASITFIPSNHPYLTMSAPQIVLVDFTYQPRYDLSIASLIPFLTIYTHPVISVSGAKASFTTQDDRVIEYSIRPSTAFSSLLVKLTQITLTKKQGEALNNLLLTGQVELTLTIDSVRAPLAPPISLTPQNILNMVIFHDNYDRNNGATSFFIPFKYFTTIIMAPRLEIGVASLLSSHSTVPVIYFMTYKASAVPLLTPTSIYIRVSSLDTSEGLQAIIQLTVVQPRTSPDNPFVLLSTDCQPTTDDGADEGNISNRTNALNDSSLPTCTIDNKYIQTDMITCYDPSDTPYMQLRAPPSVDEVHATFLTSFWSHPFTGDEIPSYTCYFDFMTTHPAGIIKINDVDGILQRTVAHYSSLVTYVPVILIHVSSYSADSSLMIEISVFCEHAPDYNTLFQPFVIIGLPFSYASTQEGFWGQYLVNNDNILSTAQHYGEPQFMFTFREKVPKDTTEFSFAMAIPFDELLDIDQSEFSIHLWTSASTIPQQTHTVSLPPEATQQSLRRSIGLYPLSGDTNNRVENAISFQHYLYRFSIQFQANQEFHVEHGSVFTTSSFSSFIALHEIAQCYFIKNQEDPPAQFPMRVYSVTSPSYDNLVLPSLTIVVDSTTNIITDLITTTDPSRYPLYTFFTRTLTHVDAIDNDSTRVGPLTRIIPQSDVQPNSDVDLEINVSQFPLAFISPHTLSEYQSDDKNLEFQLMFEFSDVKFVPAIRPCLLTYYTLEPTSSTEPDDAGNLDPALDWVSFTEVEHTTGITVVITSERPSQLLVVFTQQDDTQGNNGGNQNSIENVIDKRPLLTYAMSKFRIHDLIIMLQNSTPELDGIMRLTSFNGPAFIRSYMHARPIKFPTIYDLYADTVLVPGPDTPTWHSGTSSPMRIRFTVATVVIGVHYIIGPYPLHAVDAYCISKNDDIMGEIAIAAAMDGMTPSGEYLLRMQMNPSGRSIQCEFYADVFLNQKPSSLTAHLLTTDMNVASGKEYTFDFTYPPLESLPARIVFHPNQDFTNIDVEIANMAISHGGSISIVMFFPFPYDLIDNNTSMEYDHTDDGYTYVITYSDSYPLSQSQHLKTPSTQLLQPPPTTCIVLQIEFTFTKPRTTYEPLILQDIKTMLVPLPRMLSLAIAEVQIADTNMVRTITIPALSSEYILSMGIHPNVADLPIHNDDEKSDGQSDQFSRNTLSHMRIPLSTTTLSTFLVFNVTSLLFDMPSAMLFMNLQDAALFDTPEHSCVFIDHNTQQIIPSPHILSPDELPPFLSSSSYMAVSGYNLSIRLPILRKDNQIDVICQFPPTAAPIPARSLTAHLAEIPTGIYSAATASASIPPSPFTTPIQYLSIHFSIDGHYKRELEYISIQNLIFDVISDLFLDISADMQNNHLKSIFEVDAMYTMQSTSLIGDQHDPMSLDSSPLLTGDDITLDLFTMHRVYNSTAYFYQDDVESMQQPLRTHRASDGEMVSLSTLQQPLMSLQQSSTNGGGDDERARIIAPATIFHVDTQFRVHAGLQTSQLQEYLSARRTIILESNYYRLESVRQGPVETGYDEAACRKHPFCGVQCRQRCPSNMPCQTHFDCMSLYCHTESLTCQSADDMHS